MSVFVSTGSFLSEYIAPCLPRERRLNKQKSFYHALNINQRSIWTTTYKPKQIFTYKTEAQKPFVILASLQRRTDNWSPSKIQTSKQLKGRKFLWGTDRYNTHFYLAISPGIPTFELVTCTQLPDNQCAPDQWKMKRWRVGKTNRKAKDFHGKKRITSQMGTPKSQESHKYKFKKIFTNNSN